MKYRAEIDGLRAIAVLPVILFHAGFDLFSGGYVGVDVFFVISGYLITSILISDIENNRFSLANFYERRARRILPVLFFVMLVCVPISWYLMVPSQMKDFSQSLFAVSLFASNILFWSQSDYFAASAEEKPLLHTWSLAVEEQYYFIFPIFLLLTWRYGKSRVFWLIVCLSLASLALSEWGWRNKPVANFYLAPTRAWELLAGSISAFLINKRGVAKNSVLALLGLLAIIFSIFFYDKETPFPSLYALPTVLGTVCVILFAEKSTLTNRILSTRILVGIGLISYSAYLWHQPLFAFSRIKTLEPLSSIYLIFISAAALVLAFFSWRFIENPFRNRFLVTRNMMFYSIPFVLFLPFALGLVGHITNGFEKQLLTDKQLRVLRTATTSPKRERCHTGGRDYLKYDEACEYFDGELTVAVFGDSHAVELAYALAEELAPSGQSLKHLSFSNCIPSYAIVVSGYEDCSRWTNDTVNRLSKDPAIQTVVISYRINAALFGGHEATYPRLPGLRSEEDVERIWLAYTRLLVALEEAGKKVILVLQAPELNQPIDRLIERSQNPNAEISSLSRDWWLRRTEFVRDRVQEIPESIDVVDPSELFCNETHCFAARDGLAYYFDDDHLSINGAALVVKKLKRLIGE